MKGIEPMSSERTSLDSESGKDMREKVTIDDVLRHSRVPKDREVSPLTRIGYKLAIFLLLYLSAVTLIILIQYCLTAVPEPL